MRLILSLLVANLLTLFSAAYAAEPNGLYLMTRYIMGSSLEVAGWYFKNGHVSNHPVGNIQQFDFGKAAAEAPNNTGTYTISGNKLTIKWANGKQETADMEPDASGFCWQMGIFCPVKPFPANQKLEGKYTGGASAGYGKAVNATTITFSGNGQYSLGQVGSVHSDTSNGTQLRAGSVGEESGTYQLSGTTLTLKGSGKTRQILTFPYDDGTTGPSGHLFFDSCMLKKIQ